MRCCPSLRSLGLAFLLFGSTAAVADSAPMDASLAPWGGQGEIMLAVDAPERELQIAALRDERDRLAWVADAGGFPSVATSRSLDLGVVDAVVEVLRRRLTLSNDLPEALNWPTGSLEAQTYDFDVMQAVQRFQMRHGIEASGQLDATTLRVMNVPVQTWISQIDARLCVWSTRPDQPADAPMAIEGVVVFSTPEGASPGCLGPEGVSGTVVLAQRTDSH